MSVLDLAKWCWVSCYLQNIVTLEKTKLQRHCLDIASRNQKWLALASIAPKGQWWCLCDLENSGFNWFNSPGAEVVTQQLQEKLNKRPFKEDWEAAIGRPQILGTRSAFQPFANLALKQNTCNLKTYPFLHGNSTWIKLPYQKKAAVRQGSARRHYRSLPMPALWANTLRSPLPSSASGCPYRKAMTQQSHMVDWPRLCQQSFILKLMFHDVRF